MLCWLPWGHPRYGWIGEVAHFGVSFVIVSAFFAGAVHPPGCAASVWLTTRVAQVAQASPGSRSSLTMVPVAALSTMRRSRCSW